MRTFFELKMADRAKLKLTMTVIFVILRWILSFETILDPRTHPLDPECILFASNFKPTGLESFAISWRERELPREVRQLAKGARSPMQSILLILAGDIECNPGPAKPNYKFPCVWVHEASQIKPAWNRMFALPQVDPPEMLRIHRY